MPIGGKGISMHKHSRILSFEDLKVFQVAQKVATRIYQITQQESFRRDFGLKDQIQRASVSVLSNIAEGFERGSNVEFIQFLYVSKGSCGEMRAQLILAKNLQYINEKTFNELYLSSKLLSSMIFKLIDYLKRSNIQGFKYKPPTSTS